MTGQVSIDRFTPRATSRSWFKAWRSPHQRARVAEGVIGHAPLAPLQRPAADPKLAPMDVRVLSGAALAAVLMVGAAAVALMPASCQNRSVPFAAGASSVVALSVPAGRACSVSVTIGSV